MYTSTSFEKNSMEIYKKVEKSILIYENKLLNAISEKNKLEKIIN